MTESIGIIILGAGASSRMGRPKQLLELEGENLANRALRIAKELACGPAVLVLGANARGIRESLAHPDALIAINENWATGMGSSIVTGMKKLLQNSPSLAAVLILLVDQPLITTLHLQAMIKKWQKKNSPLVAAFYENSLGVPALFSAELFPKLLTLSGEKGAKKIIYQLKNKVSKLPLPAAKIDLDTPEEWQTFLKQKNLGNY